MNILLLTPSPPDDLHRIRALQILKALARKHAVTLLTFVRNDRDREKCECLTDYCSTIHMVPFSLPRALFNCLIAVPTPIPLRVAYCRSPAMKRKLDELLRNQTFDLIYVKRKRMGQYAQHLTTPPRVLDLTDAVALYYKRSLKTVAWTRYPIHLEEYLKIRRYEPMLAGYFDRTVACSRVDADYLEQQAGRPIANLRVIPNVVDTDFYRSDGPPPAVREPVLLFSGLMDKHVNVDAAMYLANDIFPAIRKRRPDACLYIVGPRPAPQVRALEQVPGVTVTGYVDDLRDYIAKASVVLCPVRVGAGTRNKILQAMSMQRPVVSTPLGAEGLDYEPGRDLMIAQDAVTFGEHTLRLLDDSELSSALAERGRRLVARQYSVDVQAALLADLFAELGLDS
jgi:sugar transferase (PEP-CTERM/EpsH1 system associated)